MAYYQATLVRGDRIDLTGLIGVTAEHVVQARAKLTTELTRRGRVQYYNMWCESGQPILISTEPGERPYSLIFMGGRLEVNLTGAVE